MERKACCRSTARSLYDWFAAAHAVEADEEYEAQLLAALSKYPVLAETLDQWADVRVGRLPPPDSATILKSPCPDCDGLVSVVIVGSPILRVVEQLCYLYGSLVTHWEYEDGNLRYTVREPDESDFRCFESIISAYVRGDDGQGIATPSLSQTPQFVRNVVTKSVEIGKLWIVAHELAHALQSSIAIYLDLQNWERQRLVAEFLDHDFPDVGPQTRKDWSIELDADIKATDLVFDALFERLDHIQEPRMRAETAAGMFCGGLNAALEGVYRLEVATIGERVTKKGFVPAHPPTLLRWRTSLARVGALAGDREGVDIAIYGKLIGGISAHFKTEHQRLHGLF